MLLTLSLADCAPVGPPGEANRRNDQLDLAPYAVGDLVSLFAVLDERGQAVDQSSLLNKTTVLLFGAPGGASGDLLAESIRRVAEVEGRLRPESLPGFQVLVFMLDAKTTSATGVRAMVPDADSRWRLVVGPEQALLDLAAGFGVVRWADDAGNLQHTLRTVVVTGEARVLDLFVGLDDWTPSDLLAAVSAASR